MNDADRLELPAVGPEGLDQIWDEVGHELNLGPLGTRVVYDYYDRAGNPISMRDHMRLRMADYGQEHKYTIVKQEDIGDYWVSTVWIGHNYNFMEGPPLIFETMVFRNSTGESDLECWRYSTEEQAREGHERMCNEVRLIASLE